MERKTGLESNQARIERSIREILNCWRNRVVEILPEFTETV
jgi:hypothetical protein